MIMITLLCSINPTLPRAKSKRSPYLPLLEMLRTRKKDLTVSSLNDIARIYLRKKKRLNKFLYSYKTHSSKLKRRQKLLIWINSKCSTLQNLKWMSLKARLKVLKTKKFLKKKIKRTYFLFWKGNYNSMLSFKRNYRKARSTSRKKLRNKISLEP